MKLYKLFDKIPWNSSIKFLCRELVSYTAVGEIQTAYFSEFSVYWKGEAERGIANAPFP